MNRIRRGDNISATSTVGQPLGQSDAITFTSSTTMTDPLQPCLYDVSTSLPLSATAPQGLTADSPRCEVIRLGTSSFSFSESELTILFTEEAVKLAYWKLSLDWFKRFVKINVAASDESKWHGVAQRCQVMFSRCGPRLG